MKVKGIGIAAIVLAVTACTTLDPYTREEQVLGICLNGRAIRAAPGRIS